jgi:N-acyl amino acid synthase of PEP-CTERM/exosortase system
MFQSEAFSSVEESPTPFQSYSEQSLLQSFKSHFETVDADQPQLMSAAYRLRYQVYCVEKQFEDSKAHPNELERDEFDFHSVQGLLLHRTSGIAVGTARLVLPRADAPKRSFAIQRLLRDETMKLAGDLPHGGVAEVSRFSISRQSVKRLSGAAHDGSQADYRSGPLMRLGLLHMLIRMSVMNGITHWYGLIEPSLMRMMSAMSFNVVPMGPLVEYHGMRQPCFCSLSKVLAEVKRERPSFWEVLTDGGQFAVA